MNLILEIIRESKDQNKFISIWNYSDNESFYFGKVLSFTDELTILQHYTKYGKKDGIIVLKNSEIISIDYDDEYTLYMSYVVKNSEKIFQEEEFVFDFIEDENWQYNLLKQLEGKTNILTALDINNENYIGFIKQVEEETFIIALIDSLGESNGFSIFKTLDINEIKVNDQENRKRLLLYNFRNKFQ